MQHLEDGTAYYATYNGIPLVLTALVTQLQEVLVEDAYTHISRPNERLASGYEEIMKAAEIFGHVTHVDGEFHETTKIAGSPCLIRTSCHTRTAPPSSGR